MGIYRVAQLTASGVELPPIGQYHIFLDENGNWMKVDSNGNITTTYDVSGLDTRISNLESASGASTNSTVLKLPETKQSAGQYRSGGVIMANNKLKVWGAGNSRQLGQGALDTARSFPMNVQFPSTGLTVDKWYRSGYSNWCIMSNGDVYAWGYNGYGQLGTGNNTNVSIPTKIQALDGIPIVEISVGADEDLARQHVFFRTSNGTVYGAGLNNTGQLGLNDTTNRNTPTALAKTDFEKIYAVGGDVGSSYGIDSNGDLWSWGWNGNGHLGLGNVTQKISPTQVTALSGVIKIASQCDRQNLNSGGYGCHTLALMDDGRVFSFGFNAYGQLGIGSNTQQTSPIEVTALGNDNADIFVNGGYYGFSCVLKNDATIRTFGYNAYGQLGNGGTVHQNTPIIPAGISNVTKVLMAGNAKYYSIYVLDANGIVKGCGYNGTGNLGTGNNLQSNTFKEVLMNDNVVTDICVVGYYNEYGLGMLTDSGLYFQTGYAGTSQLPEDDDEGTYVPYYVQF